MDNFRRRTAGVCIPKGAMLNGSEAVEGDVLFSSNDGKTLCIIHGLENWPDNGWTPIGIVVVPGSHNRYGDGTCGIVSLTVMDADFPEDGEDGSSIRTGPYKDGVFCGGSNAIYIAYLRMNNNTVGAQSGAVRWPYGGTLTEPNKSVAMASYKNGDGYVYNTSGYPFGDFNGIRNTSAVYVATLDNTSWTASSVLDNVNNSPAFVCAGRFKTIGTRSFIDVYGDISLTDTNYGTPNNIKTNTGFWYLPALGELSYLPLNGSLVNETLNSLSHKYGNMSSTGQSVQNTTYHSSSYKNQTQLWTINPYNGYLNYYTYTSGARACAFLRL